MRVLLLALLLLAPPVTGTALGSATCPGTTHVQRNLTDEDSLHATHQICVAPASGQHQAGATLASKEDGNVTLLVTHARTGERSGAHGVSETVDVRLRGTNATTTYGSSRDAAGFTRCALRGSYVLPVGVVNVSQPLPLCVPQEALQP